MGFWDELQRYENLKKSAIGSFSECSSFFKKQKSSIVIFEELKNKSCISMQRIRKKQKPPLTLFEKLKSVTDDFSFLYPCILTDKPIFLYMSHPSTILKIKNLIKINFDII